MQPEALEKITSEAHYDFELIQSVRQMDQRSCTPVIMFSANPVEAEGLKAGADEFLQKLKAYRC